MGKFYTSVPESLFSWIDAQHVFWVATAPLSGQGHVNVSPKGMVLGPSGKRSFELVDANHFWYLDLTGSGSETASHLYENGNGRITILFNAFEGGPRILRLFGHGTVHELGSPKFESLLPPGDERRLPGSRSIIWVDVHQVGTSCGFSVPFFEFKSYRMTLDNWAQKREKADREGNVADGLERYWAHKNAFSMDGLPALKRGSYLAKRDKVTPVEKLVGIKPAYSSKVHVKETTALVVFLFGIFTGILLTTIIVRFSSLADGLLHIRGSGHALVA